MIAVFVFTLAGECDPERDVLSKLRRCRRMSSKDDYGDGPVTTGVSLCYSRCSCFIMS